MQLLHAVLSPYIFIPKMSSSPRGTPFLRRRGGGAVLLCPRYPRAPASPSPEVVRLPEHPRR